MQKNNQPASQEKFKTLIGGQALIEGILMQGPDKRAIVVRGPEGLVQKVEPIKKKTGILTWPLIRGVVNFGSSMVNGVKALMYSADFFPEAEGEPSKFETWLEKKLGSEKLQKVVVYLSVVLGVALSVGLFILLPTLLASFIPGLKERAVLRSLIEGVFRILIFLGYMIMISKTPDMKRVFSYHGAEHKTIRCYEAQLPLTVENVRPQTRLHPRCGTSFLFVVIIISILVSAVFSSIFPISNTFLRMLSRLAMLPFIVAIAYEFNRLVGRHDNWLTKILTAPGMWFQLFTTNGDLYLNARKALRPGYGENAGVYARELLALASGKSVAALLSDCELYASEAIEEKLNDYLARALAGEPLAYILGEWSFYGLPFIVTPDVLIPRDDTMAVTELAIEAARTYPAPQRVLDLCTGSGCIGLALAHSVESARVTLAEISEPALRVAKQNTANLRLKNRVTAFSVDVLQPAPKFLGQFDLIVSNPPYVTTKEMATLDVSVWAYEPHLALEGGEDGLDFYRAILQNFNAALRPGGTICFEFGYGQENGVGALLEAAGFTDMLFRKDLRGVTRAVAARKPE